VGGGASLGADKVFEDLWQSSGRALQIEGE
jgi:hypothetical protein